jgi:hypothetical protein
MPVGLTAPMQSAATPRPRGLLLYLETTAKLLKMLGAFLAFFSNAY